jgi:hypothetical protein
MLRLRPTALTLLGVTLAAAVLGAPARAADFDKYLPDQTLFVVALNVKQLLNAPLLKSDEKAYKQSLAEATKALEGFGVDPAKDVNRVIFAAGEDMKAKNLLILVEGHFDPAKLQAKLDDLAKEPKYNLKTTKVNGATVYQGRLPQQPVPTAKLPEQVFFTVLDDSHMAVAMDEGALKDALAKKSGARKADVKKQVLDLIGQMSPQQTVTLVVVPPPEALAGSPVAGLTDVTGGVTVSDGVKTEIKFATKDAEAAKTLAQLIEDGLNQAKLFIPAVAGSQPGFGPKEQAMVKEMMDSIKTTAKQDAVIVQSTISKEFIEKNSKKDQ